MLRLLGVLDSHNLPHKGRQRSTQKTEQQRQKRRQVAAIALAKLLSCSDPGRAQNAVPTESEHLRAERLRPGRCTQPRASLRRFLSEHRRTGAVCAPREGTGPAGLRHCVHTTVLFVCGIPPPHSAAELVSLKKQQTEEVKQREPPWLVTFSAAAAQLSGWTAGAPREADCDCPAPPEVLAKEPACS